MEQLPESKNGSSPATIPSAAVSRPDAARLEIFSTCPESSGTDRALYARRVIETARWSEAAGCKGILVYSDNSLIDPWLVCHLIVQNTAELCPLVAVQPIYMHPYTVAKVVASFAHLYGRRIYLNMIAGGFKNDLLALNDTTPHDARYDRLVEYTTIIRELLAGRAPLCYDGKFYKTDKLKLTPALPAELFPGIFVSGSSEAGVAAAQAIGATAIKYPRPPGEEDRLPAGGVAFGVRVGVIARQGEKEAWSIARARFPEDRKGQLTRQLASKISDSLWHRQLANLGAESRPTPYWLVPFENYKTNCPYLVGGYDAVAAELGRYLNSGYRTFIVDIPPSEDELAHTRAAFERALDAAL